MRNATVDGEDVIVHEEVSFDVVTFYEANETSLSEDGTRVSWVNGKPEAITEELAVWLRDAGVEPNDHDIKVVTDDSQYQGGR